MIDKISWRVLSYDDQHIRLVKLIYIVNIVATKLNKNAQWRHYQSQKVHLQFWSVLEIALWIDSLLRKCILVVLYIVIHENILANSVIF